MSLLKLGNSLPNANFKTWVPTSANANDIIQQNLRNPMATPMLSPSPGILMRSTKVREMQLFAAAAVIGVMSCVVSATID
jgi:hypothetical protein